jgi:hypothetical protein
VLPHPPYETTQNARVDSALHQAPRGGNVHTDLLPEETEFLETEQLWFEPGTVKAPEDIDQ